MATVMVDCDSYAEEERTFDFGEEDLIDIFNPLIVKEYGGEDYSKYFNEDNGIVMDENYQSQLELGADQLNNELIDEDGNYYDTIQDFLEVHPLQHNISQITEIQQSEIPRKSNKSEKLKWLRSHVSKATMPSRLKDGRQSSPQHDILSSRDNNPNKIYNFSFADSKMGYSLAALIQESQQPTETLDENADSGIGLENNEVPEIINELPGLQRSSWWSLGTLSSRLQGSPSNKTSSIKTHSASSPFLSNSSHLSKSTNNLNKNRTKNSLNRMWQKVTDTLSRKQKSGLSIKTEEIHF